MPGGLHVTQECGEGKARILYLTFVGLLNLYLM